VKAGGQNTIGRGGQQQDFLPDEGKGGNQESSIL